MNDSVNATITFQPATAIAFHRWSCRGLPGCRLGPLAFTVMNQLPEETDTLSRSLES
jgi:hypothetical protein